MRTAGFLEEETEEDSRLMVEMESSMVPSRVERLLRASAMAMFCATMLSETMSWRASRSTMSSMSSPSWRLKWPDGSKKWKEESGAVGHEREGYGDIATTYATRESVVISKGVFWRQDPGTENDRW